MKKNTKIFFQVGIDFTMIVKHQTDRSTILADRYQ